MTGITFEDAIRYCSKFENASDIRKDPWRYIECLQGPQMQDYDIAVSMTAINILVFVTGLIGNVLVCVVIVRHPALNSPTDYFLLNLALSDLTLLIFGLPYDIMLYWYPYPWILGVYACQGRALITEMASYVSVLTVVTFSTERYLAICHPLHKLSLSTAQRCMKVIMILWTVSFICALPFAFYSEVHYLPYPNSTDIIKESALCAVVSQKVAVPLTEVSSIIFFIVPMIAIIYQYANMGIVIHKSTKSRHRFGNSGNGSVHGRQRRMLQSKTIIKMLSLVVLGFFGCWFPFHIQRLSSIHLPDHPISDHLNYWLYLITGIFYYFSSTLNPILYNVMSDRMRNAFKDVLCGVKQQQRILVNTSQTRANSCSSDRPLVQETTRLKSQGDVVEISRHTIELNIIKIKLKDIIE